MSDLSSKTSFEHWSVTVEADAQTLLTISTQHVAGTELNRQQEAIVEQAAHHLLAFIGRPVEPAAPASKPSANSEQAVLLKMLRAHADNTAFTRDYAMLKAAAEIERLQNFLRQKSEQISRLQDTVQSYQAQFSERAASEPPASLDLHIQAMCGWAEILAEKTGWTQENAASFWSAYDAAKCAADRVRFAAIGQRSEPPPALQCQDSDGCNQPSACVDWCRQKHHYQRTAEPPSDGRRVWLRLERLPSGMTDCLVSGSALDADRWRKEGKCIEVVAAETKEGSPGERNA